jgi:ribonuclease BN (tRNA processing enzyme)
VKITVLGCYAPYAPKDGACNGYLLQSDRINLMLECGHGSFSQLQKYIDFRQLHSLIITHFHPDHYGDIHAIRHAFAGAIRDGSRKDPLVVYIPKVPQNIYEEINSWEEAFVVIPIEDALDSINPLEDLKLEFFPVKHPLTNYGVKINYNNKIFTYTSDTMWDHDLISSCWQSDLLLTEASLRGDGDDALTRKGHMTAKQAGMLGRDALVKRLVITHFWPEFNLYQLQREAEVGFEGPVEFAEMGKVFQI